MSDPAIIGLGFIVTILAVTITAICRYKEVGPVIQIWGVTGTLIGFTTSTMGTYFFTKEKAELQASQTKMFQTALLASEQQKIEAGKQLWEVAAKIKPDIGSPQTQQAIERLQSVAGDLSRQIYTTTTEKRKPYPSPSAHATPPRTFFDLYKKNTPPPSPSP